MKNILTLMLCFAAQICFSQTGKALFDEGEKLYNERKYDDALAKLAEAYKSLCESKSRTCIVTD